MPIERKKIVKPYLLLCEGRDAENFLITYLESEALTQDKRFSNEIQVLDFGGNDDLDRFLMNLKNMERFDQVTSIAIIRDAERDFAQACSDVTRSLRKSGIVSPDSYGTWVNDDTGLNVGYLLFPLNNEAGTLEDLCLNIVIFRGFFTRKSPKDFKNQVHTPLELEIQEFDRHPVAFQ